jgi:hypothetical protein
MEVFALFRLRAAHVAARLMGGAKPKRGIAILEAQ